MEDLKPKYGRVILKLSGEGFGHSGKSGISIDETLSIARQAQRIVQRGVQLAIVVGGGNILRGAQFTAGGEVIKRGDRPLHGHARHRHQRPGPAGRPGKPATARPGCMTAIRMENVAEPYIRRRCHPPSGEGPDRHPRRRHRQSVRHHRHRRRPACPRTGGRHPPQSHQGRWRLQRRSRRRTRTRSATRS